MEVNLSQHVRLCLRMLDFVFCLNGWFGFGGLGSNMGELPSPEVRFWKPMFFFVIVLWVGIPFLEMKF